MSEVDLTAADELEHPHERLAWARRRAGYATATAFARAIGIHETTYRAYEAGQNGFAKLIPTLARKLGVTGEWLLEGYAAIPARLLPGPPPKAVIESDIPPVVGAADVDGAVTVKAVDLNYAMGDGSNLDDYVEATGVQFDPNFLRSITRAPAEALFVAKGDGDSMFPTLLTEDQVLIDTSQRRLSQQDRIWACSLHGAGMIKRLRVVSPDRVEVRSDNPTVGHIEVAAADLHIIGRVIWIGRRM